jgi:hypothetical protein
LTLVALMALGANPSLLDPIVTGTDRQAQSANFVVTSNARDYDARQAAMHFESWRRKLGQYWRDDAALPTWLPKCQIVIHASARHYQAAVGGGFVTYGSSLIDFDKDRRVSRRQIDLRGDSALGMAALPHELTHVMLADWLDGRQPPRWADEGMAILADSLDKQLLHERDLAAGVNGRIAFRLAELFALDSYPTAARVPVFYGQSASLAAFLARRNDPAKFVEFLRRGEELGYDRAVREIYVIEGLAQLERLWQAERLAANSGYHGVRLTLDDAQTDMARRTE